MVWFGKDSNFFDARKMAVLNVDKCALQTQCVIKLVLVGRIKRNPFTIHKDKPSAVTWFPRRGFEIKSAAGWFDWARRWGSNSSGCQRCCQHDFQDEIYSQKKRRKREKEQNKMPFILKDYYYYMLGGKSLVFQQFDILLSAALLSSTSCCKSACKTSPAW